MDDIPIIKLPQVQKLPKSITWAFLARNKRVEDAIRVKKKGKFNKEEDYLLLSTIQHHGLSETVLDCLSEELEAKPHEIKARYGSLLKQDQQKHNNTVDLESKLEVAMDSFDKLFCRQCLVFDCQLHYVSQGLVLPSEKQPPMMPSEEYCNIPCGIHCHRVQAAIVNKFSALNLGSDISQTTSMDVSESMNWNNICSRINSNPSCDKSVVQDGSSKFWHCKPATIKNEIKTENEPETLRNSTIKTEIKELKIHSQLKFLHVLDDGGWSTLEKDLYEKGVQIFGRNSCLIASNLLSGLKTCAEIAEYMHWKDESTDRKDPMEIECVIKKPRLRQCVKREVTPRSTDGNELMPQYTPCKCQSACGDGCSCLQKGIYCEKYCGCSKNCKNRFRGCHCVKSQCMTRYCPCFAVDRECDPDICQNCWIGCGDGSLGYPPDEGGSYECENMRILLMKKQEVLLGRSEISGWGVFAKKNMKKDEYIGEYTGELISHEKAEKRGKKYDKQNSSFLFDLNLENVLDACRMGSKMKFINHSSTPNCYAKVIMVCGDHRMGIFAKRNIQAAEELFFDYKYKPHTMPEWMKKELDPHPKRTQTSTI